MEYIKIGFIILLTFLFTACSQEDFNELEPGEQNGIKVLSKYWRGTFDPEGGFELKVINNENDYHNCQLIFDDKYSQPLIGLHNIGKGIIKDSTFHEGDTLYLPFSHDISNLQFYKIPEENYVPKTIRIKCDECDLLWNFK